MARKPAKKSALRTNAKLKRAKFIEHYLEHQNATQAAIAAGYSARTAKQTGSELLSHPDVKAAIGAIMQAAYDRYAISADRVVHELACLGLSNMKHIAGKTLDEMSDDEAAAIKKMTTIRRRFKEADEDVEEETTTIELVDKTRPLHMLGQHVGIFKDGSADPINFTLIIEAPRTREQRLAEARNVTPAR